LVSSNSLPVAVVLDGNQRAALATVRSLGRRGVPVIVAECKNGALASASRYCRKQLTYPDPARFPQAFTDWLAALGQQYPGAVLLPMTDLTVPLVLAGAPRFPALRLGLPTLAAYEAVSDKFRLYEQAIALGVRVPQTTVITRADVASLRQRELHFPLAVKPRLSTQRVAEGIAKRPVRYAHDIEELIRVATAELGGAAGDLPAPAGAVDLLLQQYVTGYGAGVFGLYDQGRPLFFFAHRRLRERPPSGGVSVLSQSVTPPAEALESARRLLEALHWHGVAMVEFKIDPSGNCWLIEINARFWGSLQLAVDSGADFPWLLYQLITGRPPAVPAGFRIGQRLRWWLGDLDNLYAQLRQEEHRGTVLQSVQAIATFAIPWLPRMRYEFMRWGDPGPAFKALQQYVAAFGRKK
jgi:predicted ATP-grasp superfamily ATP-dependent carboligase